MTPGNTSNLDFNTENLSATELFPVVTVLWTSLILELRPTSSSDVWFGRASSVAWSHANRSAGACNAHQLWPSLTKYAVHTMGTQETFFAEWN